MPGPVLAGGVMALLVVVVAATADCDVVPEATSSNSRTLPNNKHSNRTLDVAG